MRHRSCFGAALVTLLLGLPLAADETADGLRAAEIAFAASVAERDAEAFASFIDEGAVFVGATVLRGREAILEAWSVFFAEGGPELVWQPEIVEVRRDGLGLSRGPYTLTTLGGEGGRNSSSGTFTSIWRRDERGGWKILFDAGCPPCAAAASPGGSASPAARAQPDHLTGPLGEGPQAQVHADAQQRGGEKVRLD